MKRTPQQAYVFLKQAAYKIGNHGLNFICDQNILEDEKFHKSFGGSAHHHVYEGGLMVHTAEVVENCTISMPGQADYDTLISAAIAHDYMKTREYEGGVKTDYAKKINHVSGGAIWMGYHMARAWMGPIDEDQQEDIIHCMLSHHGRKEWGSIVEPQTVEANILHFADYMSMMFGEGK